MLGWNISIYRQTDGGSQPGTPTSEQGARIAVWQAGSNGLKWLDELVAQKNAVSLGRDGYPLWYTAQAEHLIPRIIDKPPGANAIWTHGPHDILGEGWVGKTEINRAAAESCKADDWLLVEAWDES